MLQGQQIPGRTAQHGGKGTSRACSRSTAGCRAVRCLAVLTAPSPAKQATVQLPDSLRNNTVCLEAPNADGSTTKVYLLGMSHVSKASVDQVKELIRAVRPEVVGIELCKDRLGLLIDSSQDTASTLLWHSRKVLVEGLPEGPEWPTWEQLKPLLRSQPGRPVTTQDIEADVVTLLSTGLFRTARPQCQNGGYDDVPAFIATPRPPSADSSEPVVVQTVPPLAAIKFVVTERVLPAVTEMTVRLDSSLKAAEHPEAELQAVCAGVLAACKPEAEGGQVPALKALLQARQCISKLFAGPVVVSFDGVETGKVEASVRRTHADDTPFISGFEGTALNGEGWGIEAFKPNRKLHKVSNKLFLPQEYVDRLVAEARGLLPSSQGGQSDASGPGAAPLQPPCTVSRPWTQEELAGYTRPSYPGSAMSDILGAVLVGLYAKHQSKAARQMGITPGSAWQAAMQAASEVGAQQVVLIDRPTAITERKLSDGLVAAAGPQLAAAAGLVVSSIVAALATDILSPTLEAVACLGAAAAALGLVWPVWGPIREVEQLSEMSSEQIEAAVAVREPIASGDLSQPLKLFGEDGLLGWPGAMGPVIRDRDAYMGKALAGAATGKAVFSPVYVRDEQAGRTVWRLMAPEGAPVDAAPAGLGDGACQPLHNVKTVVGIVGSAHLRGMVKDWQQYVQQPGDVAALLKP